MLARSHIPARRSVLITLALTGVACLALGPLAATGWADIDVDMEPGTGLSVISDVTSAPSEPNETVRIDRIQAQRWSVAAQADFCGELAISCLEESDASCESPGLRVECERTFAGLTVELRTGEDRLTIDNAGGERASISVGGADDVVTGTGAASGTWTAGLGGGDDRYTGAVTGVDVVTGGIDDDEISSLGGNDRIEGNGNDDTLRAGPGEDLAIGNAGRDFFDGGAQVEAGEPDSYLGGSQFDTLSYAARTTGIFVASIAATGGASGEGDQIESIERVFGGSGPDSILGMSSRGGGGNDVLTGSPLGDTIVGERGADTLRGFDGNDTLNANDRVRDIRIECGRGTDTVFLDLVDPDVFDPRACESVDRRAVDEEAATRIDSTSAALAGRTAALRIRCPRAVGRACAGTLDLALLGSSPGPRRGYRIGAGRSALVTVSLPAADAARVRRAGRLTAVATSREQGRSGAETVAQQVALRAAAFTG